MLVSSFGSVALADAPGAGPPASRRDLSVVARGAFRQDGQTVLSTFAPELHAQRRMPELDDQAPIVRGGESPAVPANCHGRPLASGDGGNVPPAAFSRTMDRDTPTASCRSSAGRRE